MTNPIVRIQVGRDIFCYDTRQRPLGEGAMGVVYIGWNERTHERVAIKRVIDRYANIASIRQRARLEANLMFRHQNLVEMIGIWEQPNCRGPIFLVSKYVAGVNLDTYVEQNHLRERADGVARICQLVYPVMDALEYLHSKNVVHMDIKPSNIMVEQGRNVRLMDLGIAFAHDTSNTSSAGLVGTANFAAPEQLASRENFTLNVDATTDIYELGVTIYVLLTGNNPYQGGSMMDVMQRHSTVLLPYHDKVPNEVIDVLRKATQPEKSMRYQSAAELKRALMVAVRNGTMGKGKGGAMPMWIKLLLVAFGVAVVMTILILFLVVK